MTEPTQNPQHDQVPEWVVNEREKAEGQAQRTVPPEAAEDQPTDPVQTEG